MYIMYYIQVLIVPCDKIETKPICERKIGEGQASFCTHNHPLYQQPVAYSNISIINSFSIIHF